MQIERVDHHEIVGQSEILDRQSIVVDQMAAAGFRDRKGSRNPLGIDGGIVAVGEAELAAPGHVAEFIDGAGVGTGAAKRREIGDDRVGRVHHRLVALEDRKRGVGGGKVDRVVERIEPAQAMAGADRGLAAPDLDGIRQEHIGTCQIDLHGTTGERASSSVLQIVDSTRPSVLITSEPKGLAPQASLTVSVL